jgi:hypothetical protein
MENHTKYADTIYSHDDATLYVNLFIPSRVNWKGKGVVVTQHSDFPVGDKMKLSLACDKPTTMSVKIRKPYWANSATLKLNGKKLRIKAGVDGYFELNRKYKDGDTIEIEMPMAMHTSVLPDRPSRTAFLYGPTLLAAQLEGGQKSPMLVSETRGTLVKAFEQTEPLRYAADGIAYQTGDSGWEKCLLEMLPLYAIAEQPYTVYMDVLTPGEWEKQQAEYEREQKRIRQLEADSADVLNIGRMQPERDHNLTGENTSVGVFQGRKWRHAYNGWFEFDMKVAADGPTDLICTYWGSERGSRTFDILVEGKKIATQKLDRNKPQEFFDVSYPIPAELTKDEKTVRIRLQSHTNNYAGGLFGVRTIKRR